MAWRVDVDSGRTFTDVCLFDDNSGAIEVWKVSSTPDDPSRGIAAGVEEGVARVGAGVADVAYFGYGTTVGTNALIQHKGVRTGLVTTDGFRDLLEIGRQKRPDLQAEKAPVLVARDLRLEMPERVRHDGTVETALDEDALRHAVRTLRDAGVEAVAVSFLYGFVRPQHEDTARRILAEEFPDAFACTGHEVAPEFREYERLSTTVVNRRRPTLCRRAACSRRDAPTVNRSARPRIPPWRTQARTGKRAASAGGRSRRNWPGSRRRRTYDRAAGRRGDHAGVRRPRPVPPGPPGPGGVRRVPDGWARRGRGAGGRKRVRQKHGGAAGARAAAGQRRPGAAGRDGHRGPRRPACPAAADALVFQDPYASLDPRRRVGAQVADGLAIHKLAAPSARREHVEALLAQVGLAPAHADRFPHEFSGGQRQRVGIARALATRPDFLVADEAVSALDVSVQAQILALFADLRTRLGIGMLFISHDLKVVRSLCDRVIVLYLGRMVEEGRAADVLERPRHPYTQALLSASPSLDPARRRTRILLHGNPPSPSDPPSGCVFRTRCRLAVAACAAAVPPLEAVGPSHRAACLRLQDT